MEGEAPWSRWPRHRAGRPPRGSDALPHPGDLAPRRAAEGIARRPALAWSAPSALHRLVRTGRRLGLALAPAEPLERGGLSLKLDELLHLLFQAHPWHGVAPGPSCPEEINT